MYCVSCGQENDENTVYCSNCGEKLVKEETSESAVQNVNESELPLRWHKFLVYFSLFLGALMYIGEGYNAVSGIQYGDMVEVIYSYYDGLKAADVGYGIALFGLAAFAIFTRFQLAGFKRNAPNLLMILYCVPILLSFGYLLIVGGITGINMIDASFVGNILGSATIIVINKVYYNKRKHLFVN